MTELSSLQSIFKDRIFKIPDYQRGYAWTTRQLKDFWEDVVNLPTERQHYTGMLSLKKVEHDVWKNWIEEKWLRIFQDSVKNICLCQRFLVR